MKEMGWFDYRHDEKNIIISLSIIVFLCGKLRNVLIWIDEINSKSVQILLKKKGGWA